MANLLPHPAAKPERGRLSHPRYLLREDGHFVAWTAQLAKKAEMRPFNELPDWHLKKLQEAAERDARVRQAPIESQQRVVAAEAAPAAPVQSVAKAVREAPRKGRVRRAM